MKIGGINLLDFANQIGKPDPEEYINEGGWKARQGGNGLATAKKHLSLFLNLVRMKRMLLTTNYRDLFPKNYMNCLSHSDISIGIWVTNRR